MKYLVISSIRRGADRLPRNCPAEFNKTEAASLLAAGFIRSMTEGELLHALTEQQQSATTQPTGSTAVTSSTSQAGGSTSSDVPPSADSNAPQPSAGSDDARQSEVRDAQEDASDSKENGKASDAGDAKDAKSSSGKKSTGKK